MRQIAKLVFRGKWKLSKQNSYLAAKNGRRYKNPAYEAEQTRMLLEMHPQLIKQGWKCTKNNVRLNIVFYGPCLPCDWDNCGLLTDAMQGSTRIMGGKLYRSAGPVVFDDRQFIPVKIDFVKCRERQFVVEIESEI